MNQNIDIEFEYFFEDAGKVDDYFTITVRGVNNSN